MRAAAIILLFAASAMGLVLPRDGILPIGGRIRVGYGGASHDKRDGILPIGGRIRVGLGGAPHDKRDGILPIGSKLRVGHAGGSGSSVKRDTTTHVPGVEEVELELEQDELELEAKTILGEDEIELGKDGAELELIHGKDR